MQLVMWCWEERSEVDALEYPQNLNLFEALKQVAAAGPTGTLRWQLRGSRPGK